MRYHFEKPIIYLSMYGQRYLCDHPVYHSCTLFLIEEKGLAVIQQRYDPGRSVYGRTLPHRDHPADHVGAENEAFAETAMGNGVRPAGYLMRQIRSPYYGKPMLI